MKTNIHFRIDTIHILSSWSTATTVGNFQLIHRYVTIEFVVNFWLEQNNALLSILPSIFNQLILPVEAEWKWFVYFEDTGHLTIGHFYMRNYGLMLSTMNCHWSSKSIVSNGSESYSFRWFYSFKTLIEEPKNGWRCQLYLTVWNEVIITRYVCMTFAVLLAYFFDQGGSFQTSDIQK